MPADSYGYGLPHRNSSMWKMEILIIRTAYDNVARLLGRNMKITGGELETI